jgi:predicted DNA-binding transcriptional regulator AlpA
MQTQNAIAQTAPPANPTRFVDEKELAALTSTSPRTWQKYRLQKRGPRFYKIGVEARASVRYDLNEVIDWIRSNVGKVN